MLLPKRQSLATRQDSSSPQRLPALLPFHESDEQTTARQIKQRGQDSRNESYWQPKREVAGKVLGSLGAPQRKMMQVLTGNEQTPSEWAQKKGILDYNAKPIAGVNMAAINRGVGAVNDAVFDPSNLVGAGIAKKLAGAGKLEQVGNMQHMLLTGATEAEKAKFAAMAAKWKNRAAIAPKRQLLESSPTLSKDVATSVELLPERAAKPPRVAQLAMEATAAGPNRPAHVPSGPRHQSLHGPILDLAKQSPRDVYDIYLEEGAGRPLYKEKDELLRWDADKQGVQYDDTRYNQESIRRNYVGARSTRIQRPGGPLPQPATMQELAQYTREADELSPGSLRTERSRAEDIKAGRWANHPATEQQFNKLAAADGQGDVAQRLTQFRQNVQYPVFEAPIAQDLNGLQFPQTKRIFLNKYQSHAQFARTAEHEVGHAAKLVGTTREQSLLPSEFDRLNQARRNTPLANKMDEPTRQHPTGYFREPEEITSRLREVRGALQKDHGQAVGLRDFLQEMRKNHPETLHSTKPGELWQAINRMPLSALPAAAGVGALGIGTSQTKPRSNAKGGLLPKPRRYAEGGILSLDPNDPSLAGLDPVARQKELLRRQNLQNQGSDVGAQVGGGVQQAASAVSSLAGAGSGLASVASAAGPIGAAVAAGAAIGGALHKSNVEDDGLRTTSTGGQLKDGVANVLDPLGTAASAWGNDKLNVGQKVLSTIPGIGGVANTFFTKKLVDQQREKQRQQVQAEANYQGAQQSKSIYGGLSESVRGGQYRRGGLLPRRLAKGGEVIPTTTHPRRAAAAPTTSTAAGYSVQHPSPEAQKYYQNVGPAALNLLNQKHDEVYTDPQTGRSETANSCLSFADTCFEKATGSTQPRTKENLYNPSFTSSSAEQGWQRVPLNQARAGDRLQQWEQAGNDENGRVIGKSEDQQARIKDLGKNTYIPNAYPIHMTVMGSPMLDQGKGGYKTYVYQDGHQFEAANEAHLNQVSDKNYVAYRYVGKNAPASVASRAKGGLLPKPMQAMRQDATAPGSMYKGSAPAQDAPENPLVRGMRKVLPLNAAMFVQDLAGDKTSLTERDLKPSELNVLRTTARQARAQQHNHVGYEDYPSIFSGQRGAEGVVALSRSPTTRMATTIGKANLAQSGNNQTQLSDTFDFNGAKENKWDWNRLLTRTNSYQVARYLGDQFGSADGKGPKVNINLGNLKRPVAGADNSAPTSAPVYGPASYGFSQDLHQTPVKRKQGGLLPKSVIAHGALHSEKNQHAGHPTAGKRGIPVLAADGTKLAEVERDELTLTDTATQKLEKLREQGNLHGLGKHLQQELLTNTIPSPRYTKRLLPSR